MTLSAADLPEFDRLVQQYAREQFPVMPVPELSALLLPPALYTPKQAAGLEVLAPFGAENPEPLFAVVGASVTGVTSTKNGQHSRITLRYGDVNISAFWFFCKPDALPFRQGDACDLLLTIQADSWNGKPCIRARIRDGRLSGTKQSAYFAARASYEAYWRKEALPRAYYGRMLPARQELIRVYNAIGQEDMPLEALYAACAGTDLNYCKFIYQLKLANPIDTTMGRYVHLIRSGSNYKCLCPFHSEKTPSCTVYTGTQSFYCFGCGAGGDVITFTKQIENLDTYEAIKLLAERGGLEMPENDLNKDGAKLKLRILEMNREAANFFYRNLLQGQDKRGLQYAVQRGLTPKAIKKYAIGYAPAAWDGLMKHLEGLGFTREEMLSAGLIRQNARGCFDFFRERVMFPIIDLRGNVIAFGGRLIEGEGPKYLNSGDTPVFKKSRNLFSLNFAKNANVKQLILAEGYMDVIAINQAGFEQVVATLGTALTAEQARIMAQYATEVVLCYDSDSAGQNATHRAINLLSEAGLHTRILKVQDAKDPDEYIRKFCRLHEAFPGLYWILR